MVLRLILCVILFNLSNANIYEKCVNDKHISLTFDDGPHKNTINIVNTLNSYNISGTFFINGFNVIKNNYQQLVKDMHSSGHILGSHTFSHPALEKLNKFNKERELYDNEFIFRQLFNKRPYFMRPPYFSYDLEVVEISNHFGYEVITTNLNTDDWMVDSPKDIYENFLSKYSNYSGIITLIHDYHEGADGALKLIIPFMISENYTFVSLDECIGSNKKYNEDNYYGPNLLG